MEMMEICSRSYLVADKQPWTEGSDFDFKVDIFWLKLKVDYLSQNQMHLSEE